ncbi:MAG: hypothetical protein ABIJ16_00250 [Bacteroidota bacterium]
MRKERIIYTFILCIVFLMAGGFFLPKPGTYRLEYDRFWVKKTHCASEYNTVIIGDSRAYRGVSPSEMEEEFPGLKVLNFGYSSGGLNDFMFDEAVKKIDTDCKEPVIILAVAPHTLIDLENDNAHYLEQLALPREEVLEKLYLFPLLRFFTPVDPETLFKGESQDNYRQVFYDNGWVASYKDVEDTLEAVVSYREIYSKFQVSQERVDEMVRQVKAWSDSGYYVFAFRPPVSWSMKMLEDSLSGYDEAVIRNHIETAGGVWIPLNGYVFHSYDGSHLHRDSAIKLSDILAEKIRWHLSDHSP